MESTAVFFDGFTSLNRTPNALTAWQAKLGNLVPIQNERKFPQTLRDRLQRIEESLPNNEQSFSRICILAYSMGYHVALKYVERLKEDTEVQFLMIGPDPKYLRVPVNDAGTHSGFDEAYEQWDNTNPGTSFSQALKKIARWNNVKVDIVFSEQDEMVPPHHVQSKIWAGPLRSKKSERGKFEAKILPRE